MNICVLIPAFNEEKTIVKTLRSVMDAGVGCKDTYVIDDGSRDNTAALAKLFGAKVLRLTNGGKARALRIGFDAFCLRLFYSHVAVLDADSCVSKGYFTAMREAAERYPDAALLCGGPRSLPHNWLTAYRAVEYAVSLGIYREAQSFMGVVNVSPGCASVYRTEVFDTLHFDGDTLVEDMDLTMQLQRRGEKIVYVPDAIVYTQDPSTLRGFIGQIRRWYRGTWQVVRKHRIGRRVAGIDAEMVLMLGEGLMFSLLILLLPVVVYFYPLLLLWSVVFDQAMLLAFTLLVAVRERRIDVIVGFPLFTIPRVLNFYTFLWAFLVERRPREMSWYSVARY